MKHTVYIRREAEVNPSGVWSSLWTPTCAQCTYSGLDEGNVDNDAVLPV